MRMGTRDNNRHESRPQVKWSVEMETFNEKRRRNAKSNHGKQPEWMIGKWNTAAVLHCCQPAIYRVATGALIFVNVFFCNCQGGCRSNYKTRIGQWNISVTKWCEFGNKIVQKCWFTSVADWPLCPCGTWHRGPPSWSIIWGPPWLP